ncbi:MAG: isoaspartyl peptidase/L-asparaginase [Candidatus Latescibacterota bacterium]|nr:MAG: isoaspartyl peptidase/L-asparaginase [Candidatus Latescibacterota bacterium]
MIDAKRGTAVVLIVLLSVGLFSCAKRVETPKEPEITMVIHGGAGTILKENMTPERERAYTEKLTEALQMGLEILKNDGSSLDAVEAAIRVLEDSPLFNAGKGAVFTAQGKNELDASIMDGTTLNAGAVASVTTIKNPISAARAVMEDSKHVLLVGRGAELFAAGQGLDIVDPEYFFEQTRWDQLLKIKESEQSSLERSGAIQMRFGTVGALALDRKGNLAAGTSTGGLTNKRHGRVGDSPIVGAGTYANNATCAVSGTGQGEYFMRNLVAYDVSALMEYQGMNLDDAVEKVIQEKLTELGGLGGVIALDKFGNVAMSFNTEGMYRGWIKEDGEAQVLLYGDEDE